MKYLGCVYHPHMCGKEATSSSALEEINDREE